MEESSLYNPGFLGSGGFHWWVGQVADDSTWRDNILPGKFEDKNAVPGWGRRYKVRIIGLHDQEEETIPSDQLPWAQVMYPVTAGGGQSGAVATPQIRQGNFVFGFFLDGQEQQVPVIMGVLGNNTQTTLGKKVGTTKSNFAPTSGYATPSQSGSKDPNIKVPDEDLAVNEPGGTRENADSVHQQSIADTKKNDLYLKKTVLINACNVPKSALKAIQIVIEELTKDIDKVLQAVSSYIDAASQIISNIQQLISNAACEIAKYMKIIFDKIMEYIIKLINKALAPTINKIPPNRRHQFVDIKDSLIELLLSIYNKISNALCGQIQGFLDNVLNTSSIPTEAISKNIPTITSPGYCPSTPFCSVEELVGNLISQNSAEITNSTDSYLNNVNNFLTDVLSELGDVGEITGGITKIISGISVSIAAALSFENIKLNIFGADLAPNCAVADYYQIQSAGSSAPDSQLPLVSNVDKASQKPTTPSKGDELDFASPKQGEPDLVLY